MKIKENSIDSNYKRVRKTKKLNLQSPEKKNIVYIPELKMEQHTNKSIDKFISSYNEIKDHKIKLTKSFKNKFECTLIKDI